MEAYRLKVAFVHYDVLMYEGINKTVVFLNETDFKKLFF